ncbi:MAG: DNA mismatch repair protein MutS [Oscillospiraceae bacterium]|nr:DNA mismatch repair protein MutS [Oscillospiraceae bacterium]
MKRITKNLHEMPLIQARREMQLLLKTCPADTDEIEVIHGFHNGDRLLKYIRTELKHPRIERKLVGLNNGITVIVLRKQ